MSYKTYITEALICGSKARNTADKAYLLFTRDIGMLWGTAKSVREERSKQRYALQEFSFVRVTLVHGKSGWRITGVEPGVNAYSIQKTREARALIRNVIRLLRRFLHGEIASPTLYTLIEEVLTRVHEGNERVYEEIITIRTLHHLGYIALNPDIAMYINTDLATAVSSVSPEGGEARRVLIEQALTESHL